MDKDIEMCMIEMERWMDEQTDRLRSGCLING